jgi:hypothetical protein
MKKVLLGVIALIAVCGVLTPAVADYYATKADYRQGRVTRGPALPKAGTDDCTSPTSIPSTPFNDTGDSTGATDSVNGIPLGCNGIYAQVAGGDHIYTFDVTAGNSLTFTLSTSSVTYDPSIYILSTCGDGNSCQIGSDNCFSTQFVQPAGCQGDDSTEVINAPELTAGTYFFYVDSFYPTDNPTSATGPYTLDVTGSLPVELIEFDVK